MRILRQMAMSDDTFSYKKFKETLDREQLNPGQKMMMDLRFSLLESFLDMSSINSKIRHQRGPLHDVFQPQPGTLTIIDLSDPFLDSATVCILFGICLSIFE